jgi:hypothetical protein
VNGAQETQVIKAIDNSNPNQPTITVSALQNQYDGTKIPVQIIQGGEKGVLIAEWYEYTPNSGTDINVTTNISTTFTAPSEGQS